EFLTDIGPGPGFLPRVLSLTAAAFTMPLIVKRSNIGVGDQEDGEPFRNVAIRVLAIFGALALFLFFMQPLGFLISATLFILFLLATVESRPLFSSVLWSFGSAVIFYLIFSVGLNVNLPVGILGT